MKDDLDASEKRLIAALDRLDRFIDRAAGLRREAAAVAPAGSPAAPDRETAAELRESREQSLRLSDELAALRASHSSAITGFEARLKVAGDRLAEAEERAVELAAANEALTAANRQLLAAAGTEARQGAVHQALEAEIESFKAARNAERGKLAEIMDALDRMLGLPAGAEDVPHPAPVPEDAEREVTDASAARMNAAAEKQES